MNRLNRAVKYAEQKFGVEIEVQAVKQYENVANGVKAEAMQLIDNAMKAAGVKPNYKKERAGTTSAMIMAKHGFGGHTVFTGQNNPHNFNEWLSE